jgi:hypothetical protein
MRWSVSFIFIALLIGCAPTKDKLAMMTNYDLCEWIYKLQNSAQPSYAKYYWEELKSRNANCEPYAAQIRQQQAIQQGQMLNFFGAMGLATGIAAGSQSNQAPVTNNNIYVQPKPLPPVNITPPNTIPR